MEDTLSLSVLLVPLTVLIILLLSLVALALLALRDLYRNLGPSWLCARGRYREARRLAARPFWQKRLFASVRDSLRYTEISCLHMEGRLEESLELLRALRHDKLDRNLSYAIDTVEAGNLVLLDRESERAIECIARAREVMDTTGNLLVQAHAELSRGNTETAQHLFAQATSAEPGGVKAGLKVVLVHVAEAESMSDAFLRGWFHHRLGQPETAAADLTQAMSSPLDNVYRQRAEQLAGRGMTTDSSPSI